MRACLEDMAASSGGGGGGGGGGASVIGLRINPLVGAGAVGSLSVSTRSSKFGVVLPQERGAEREAVVAALTACAGCDAPTAALPCSPAPAALPCSPALQHPPPASLLPPPAAPHPPPPPHQGGLRHMRARAYRVRRHAPRADGAGRGGRGDARSGGQRAPRRGGRRFADPCARRGGRAARGLGRDAGPELGGVPSSGLR